MNLSDKKNGGAAAISAPGSISTAIAAGAGDATAVTGAYIDRTLGGTVGQVGSGKLIVEYKTTLSASKALSLAVSFNDATSSGGAGAAAYGPSYASTAIVTDGGSGGTYTGTVEFDVDFSGARNFIAPIVTPDLTATGTDTATISGVWVLFGSDRNPISKSLV